MNRSHTELYDILGLKSDASDTDIKNAYKKLARKYHPDKNKEPDAEEMFKKVNQANAILSDAEKKKIYDQFGLEGFEGGMGEGVDPFDIFNMMRQQQQRKQAVQMNHGISLVDYFTKTFVTITVSRKVKCDSCDATGFTDKKVHKCKHCNGIGMVMRTLKQGPMVHQAQTQCPICRGQKNDTTLTNLKCKMCSNQGTKMINEDLEVKIPSNIIGESFTLVEEKGPWVENKYIDLAIVFKLKMPKDFGMTSDRKLIHTMHINYTETICGFRRIMNHPSGKKILIVSEKGYIVNPDNIYVLDRLGFNNDALYLSFIIHYPESIILPKKKMLTFEALEITLGERRVPSINNDGSIDPENVYMLSTLSKINNNPRSKENENNESVTDDDSDEHEHERTGGIPGVNGCTQQ